MEFTGIAGGIYRLSLWISRLAYLNLLWMLFTLAGFILLGLGPATAAMFAVIRKWVMGEESVSIFKLFWASYRQEFLRANLLFGLLAAGAMLIYLNLRIVLLHQSLLMDLIQYGLILVCIVYATVLLYIFPLFVHYELSLLQYVRTSIIIGFAHPIRTIAMLLGCVAMYILFTKLFNLSSLFGASSMAFLLMKCTYQAFDLIERKKEKLHSS